MRGALLTLAIGIILGVGATLQFGMPKAVTSSSSTAKVALASPAAPAAPPAPASPPLEPIPGTVTGLPDFATLAERLSPVVVNISTRAQRKESDTPRFRGPGQPG